MIGVLILTEKMYIGIKKNTLLYKQYIARLTLILIWMETRGLVCAHRLDFPNFFKIISEDYFEVSKLIQPFSKFF